MIRNYIATQNNIVFVDIYSKMLGKDGNPRKELFVEDMLHMNRSGYAIWEKAVLPYLLRK